MPSKIFSAALAGLEAVIITIEADAGGGDFGQIKIVGLPDAALSESRERVRSAIRHCGLDFPRRRITINLAPADFKKHGTGYDLPIAMAILALKNKFYCNFSECLIAGELSLGGQIKPITGILAMVMAAKTENIKKIFIPAANVPEAQLIDGLEIYPLVSLSQIINHLRKKEKIKPISRTDEESPSASFSYDLETIYGQEKAKRALEISAAGGHNLLLFGSPGSGKTMLAKAMPSIMPHLDYEEKLEITKIYSASGELKNKASLISQRPFRAPHHSISCSSLIGGGAWPRPGEISLAHRGVLFLDEFPEFPRSILENLRQPLEEGQININRANLSLSFPAKFTLLAAMNPCPCGYAGDLEKPCRCHPHQILNYRHRLSGPIMDRFDMQVELPRLAIDKLTAHHKSENSISVRGRVERARARQAKRFQGRHFHTNAEMDNQMLKIFCVLDSATAILLATAAEKMGLSARAYFKILKLSRSIADLADEKNILKTHLAEALQYRQKLE